MVWHTAIKREPWRSDLVSDAVNNVNVMLTVLLDNHLKWKWLTLWQLAVKNEPLHQR